MNDSNIIYQVVTAINNKCSRMEKKIDEVDKKLSDLREILKLIKEKTDKL